MVFSVESWIKANLGNNEYDYAVVVKDDYKDEGLPFYSMMYDKKINEEKQNITYLIFKYYWCWYADSNNNGIPDNKDPDVDYHGEPPKKMVTTIKMTPTGQFELISNELDNNID